MNAETIDYCPLCGEPNSLDSIECRRCNYRLPWADSREGIAQPPVEKSRIEKALDTELKKLGLLPDRTMVCRYCDQPIKVDAKQCPHCQRWLVHRNHDFEMDPWSTNYDDKASRKVDMLQPRASCLSVLCLFAAISLWGICNLLHAL
jgi:hypothetical protein